MFVGADHDLPLQNLMMIGQTISHYPALRDPEQRDKILEKLGEVRLVPRSGTDETSSQFKFAGNGIV